jgi:hypothetical protein
LAASSSATPAADQPGPGDTLDTPAAADPAGLADQADPPGQADSPDNGTAEAAEPGGEQLDGADGPGGHADPPGNIDHQGGPKEK